MSDPKSMAAAEYVLGTLDLSERREFERRMASDAALRAHVSQWRSMLDPVAGAVAPVEPSAALWDRLAARIDAAEACETAASPPARRPVYRRPVPAALTLMAACLIGFVFVRQFGGLLHEAAPPTSQVAIPAQPLSPALREPAVAAAVPCAKDSKSTALASDRSAGDGSPVVAAKSSPGAGALAVDNPASATAVSPPSPDKQDSRLSVASASADRDQQARASGAAGREGCETER